MKMVTPMSSKQVYDAKGGTKKLYGLVTALKETKEKFNTKIEGEYGHTVIIKTGDVTIKNSQLDVEFTIPFDDDTEANQAEIVVYNLTSSTIKAIKRHAKITVTAGYGKDTGVIFSGYITSRKTSYDYDNCDKVTTIKALDSMKLKDRSIASKQYAKGTKASKILKDLCNRVDLPIAVFHIARDYTYTKRAETIDGKLMDNIKRLAKICGVSAYILKGKIYVRPLKEGDNTKFKVQPSTGLIGISYFEESEKNADYKDTIKGYELKMLLQHHIQTASIIHLSCKEAKGTYRVKSGEHSYDGTDMITKVKAVAV